MRSPLSARVCDFATLSFAIWTLCAHAVVALEGGLDVLLLVAPVAGAVALVGWLRARPAPSAPAPPTSPGSDGRQAPEPWLAVLGAGSAVLAGVLVTLSSVALWWLLVVGLGAAAAASARRTPRERGAPARGRGLEISLWAIALACVALTLCVHRPDYDDGFYVNLAVAAADDPAAPLLKWDTLHGIDGIPIHYPIYRLHSFELAVAALSRVTGIPAIYGFHWIVAAVGGLFVPLAHARVFRLLAPRHWLAAVATIVFLMIAVGETYRWYGNYAFVRMWQGKSIFLSVFTPLIYAYALRFALRPSVGRWLLLAAAQVAAVGCTATALWAAPVASLVAMTAALPLDRRGARTLLIGALASAYVVVVGLLFQASMTEAVPGMAESAAAGPPLGQRFDAALERVLGFDSLRMLGVASIAGAWAAATGLGRRFAIAAPLAITAILLNPYFAEWMRAHAVGPSYWRAMWALPIPILLSLVFVALLRLGPRRRALGLGVWAASVIAFGLAVPSFSGFDTRNMGAHFARPGLKVHGDPYVWAGILNRSVPAGATVVAPYLVSVWVPTYHDYAHPLQVRGYLARQRDRLPQGDFDRRKLMTLYVGGAPVPPGAERVFREGIEHYGVKGVCLSNWPGALEARGILRSAGFRRTLHGAAYEIWTRE